MLPHREAFAAWLPFWGVPFSYAVAISYVFVDTADKGVKAYKLARSELDANAALHSEVDTPRCKAQQEGHSCMLKSWRRLQPPLMLCCPAATLRAQRWAESQQVCMCNLSTPAHAFCRLEKLLAAERALDTVVWQLLASVICPGYTIHTVVALAHAGLLPLEVSQTRCLIQMTMLAPACMCWPLGLVWLDCSCHPCSWCSNNAPAA